MFNKIHEKLIIVLYRSKYIYYHKLNIGRRTEVNEEAHANLGPIIRSNNFKLDRLSAFKVTEFF